MLCAIFLKIIGKMTNPNITVSELFMEKYIRHLDDLVIDEEEYIIYLRRWLDGIESELMFWRHFIETKGKEWNTDWDNLISDDRQFGLDEYLISEETKFLDVGSGPFSSCGIKSNKAKLKIYAVDPLAYIYKAIKDKNKIKTGITPDFAFVENLNEKFGINEFDIVHMSNSLDHAFNPLIGILQMLTICKIGGRIILNHAKNEAEYDGYQGFHQWNLCINDSEFIIWRPGIKYNVAKILKEYVDFTIKDDPSSRWFTVVLIKKQNISFNYVLHDNLDTIRNELIFKKLSEIIVTNAFKFGYGKMDIIKRIVGKIPFLGYWARKIYRRYKKQKNGT
jgi:SAM-dependent methyltransferase